MIKKIFIAFFVSFLMVSAYSQEYLVSEFTVGHETGKNWEFDAQLNFEYQNQDYIIGTSSYQDENTGQQINEGFSVFQFDKDKRFVERIKLTLDESQLKNFNPFITKIESQGPDGNFKVNLLMRTDVGFFRYQGVLNLPEKSIKNLEEIYRIPMDYFFQKEFIKVTNHGSEYRILRLDKGQKKLVIYILNDNDYQVFDFQLDKPYYKRLKSNFGLLYQLNEQRVGELDLTSGFQIHNRDTFIYLLTGNCNKDILSVESIITSKCKSQLYVSDLHFFKIDLSNQSLETHTVKTDYEKQPVGYHIIENQLIYAYDVYGSIFVKKLDLDTFESKTTAFNLRIFENVGLKAYYTNYKKNSSNITTKEVEFSEFSSYFSNSPSIAIRKTDNDYYDISLGYVKYKSFNSFGDWLASSALATASANLFSFDFFSKYQINISFYYVNKEIPKIHKTSFSTNFDGELRPPTSKESNNRELVLQNMDFFLKKNLVSPIDQDNEYLLYRDKNHWENFYIVKF